MRQARVKLVRSAHMRVLHADDDNVFASEGRVIVQVRRGTMTHATLDVVAKHIGTPPTNQLLGFIVIIEDSASVPAADVRKRQQILVRRTLIDAGVHVAVVMLATGVRASILRAISRTMAIGFTRTATFSEIEPAARWLGPLASATPAAVVELVARARAVGTKTT